MKGKFTYDNKTFKWNFRIRKYSNSDVYGFSQVWYKYKITQIIGEFLRIDDSWYNNLIIKYSKKSEKEIEDIVKGEIIKEYEFKKKEKRLT